MPEYFLLGLVGHPLSHSLSPVLHTAALQFSGLQGEYRLFDLPPENFAQDLKNLLGQKLKGFNVTLPYKHEIYNLVSHHSEDACQAGAVNTVKITANGELHGHNTDIIGFKLAFEETFGKIFPKKTALIIGAGGAARGAIVALAQLGLNKILIKARDTYKVNKFISDINNQAISLRQYDEKDLYENNEIGIIINASTIGLKDEVIPLWIDTLISNVNPDCLCFDLVYRKDKSKPSFCRLALERKLQAIDGLPMLVHQARFAFEYWTGMNVPAKVMYKALDI